MTDFNAAAKLGIPIVVPYDPSAPAAGEIQAFAGATVPTGWALCDGSALVQASFPDLFTAIGSTYNTQTNPTTGAAWAAPAGGSFRVPDFRGIFLRGVGTPSGFAAVTLAGYQADMMQNHSHGLYQNAMTSANAMALRGSSGSTLGTLSMGSATADTGYLNTGAPLVEGSNGTPRVGLETRPVNKGVNYIIRLYNLTQAVYNAGVSTSGPSLIKGGYEEGTFVGNFNIGINTSTNNFTIAYTRLGRLVTLTFPDMRVTANVTASFQACAAATLPTSLRPTLTRGITGTVINGNFSEAGNYFIAANGTITIYRNQEANWTSASVNCGGYFANVTYMI